MKKTVGDCIDIIDVFDKIAQNNQRLDQHFTYMVKKNSDIIKGVVLKKKVIVDNINKYYDYTQEKFNLKRKFTTMKKKKGKEVPEFDQNGYAKAADELVKNNKTVIDNYNKDREKTIELPREFHMVNIDFLPVVPQLTMDFLVDQKLVMD